jgi:hypothetical protein
MSSVIVSQQLNSGPKPNLRVVIPAKKSGESQGSCVQSQPSCVQSQGSCVQSQPAGKAKPKFSLKITIPTQADIERAEKQRRCDEFWKNNQIPPAPTEPKQFLQVCDFTMTSDF